MEGSVMTRVKAKSIARLLCLVWFVCVTGLVKAAPHDTIVQLSERVESLAARQILTPGQGRSLGVKLDHAARQLQLGHARAAIRRLATFAKETSALHSVLPQKDAQFLIAQAQLARLEISQLAFDIPALKAGTFQPCFSDEGCEYAVLHVDAAAPGLSDGSEDHPFTSIAAALAYALKLKVCGVELRLAAGTYAESVPVPLHLKLRGRERGVVINGSIVNPDGWALGIDRLQIRSAASPGAIVTDSLCPSNTEISRVGISAATGFGVFQRGGRLRMNGSSIADTRATMALPASGTGIMLSGGVQAVIGLVDVERSHSSGLVVEGPDTRVYVAASRFANGDTALSTYGDDDSRPPASGVDIRQGALALMQFNTITGNELTGLAVSDGARLHFRYGAIDDTRDLPRSHPLHRSAASNVRGDDAAAIELTSFTSQDSLVGLLMNASPASASIGRLSNHEIGIYLNPDPPESEVFNNAFRCLIDRVTFHNIRRNVDGTFLPIPGDGSEDPPVCVRVPFDCSWCDP
jgi:hypothetical protein